MNVSIFPSGESAGEVTESLKFVICVQVLSVFDGVTDDRNKMGRPMTRAIAAAPPIHARRVQRRRDGCALVVPVAASAVFIAAAVA
jgi:hypothetical protein